MSDGFYLGKLYDTAQAKMSSEIFQYNPDDLTTHAVVVGMTGSGKTGLCISLLEEAALQGIPAILIDPKGDLTNLLLHFPDLAPQDFQPWLDSEQVRRAGKSLEQASTDAATFWRGGLSEWGIGRERLLALKNAAQFAVYTPGSDAGIPVSVLSSLASPGLDWDTHREILAGRITSTVTALLGLVGYENIDPIRSREHILLANIFQYAWSRNQSLDMTELILKIQIPPFEKLGAFAVDSFFPKKERMNLALQLNNILAAPTFELWRVGQTLNVESLLRGDDGRPRHSVFYLAHLPEQERMFFVTLLLNSVETWMRTQAGATSLRALLYMDEISGYMPPLSNPSSKQPLLRMLKQARAFGLGLILASQNPVDMDYKALSNAGTWFIGKLQTEQDKQRLLDGLESTTSGSLDRATLDKLISSLGKRLFIVKNVHEDRPVVFQTRWAMNFLAGPMTRTQIPALNALTGARQKTSIDGEGSTPTVIGGKTPQQGFPPLTIPDGKEDVSETLPELPRTRFVPAQSSLTRPPVPMGISEYFLPMDMSLTKAAADFGETLAEGSVPGGVLYRPAFAASAQVRFIDRKYSLDSETHRSVLALKLEKNAKVRWEDFVGSLPDDLGMDPEPVPQARFAFLDVPLSDARMLSALQKDFLDWLYRTSKVIVRVNKILGLYATPDVSQAEFMKACADAARQARDEAISKATAPLDRQIKVIKDKIAREERELKMDEVELGQRKGEEIATHAENILGAFGGSRYRRLSTSLTKRRLTEQAKEDVQESIDLLNQYDQELLQLEETRQKATEEASSSWGDVVNQITEVPIRPKKTDIHIEFSGVAWMPFYIMEQEGKSLEIPAFYWVQ